MSSQTHHRTNVIVDLNKIKKIQKISGENTIKGALNYAINKTIIDTERIKKMQKMTWFATVNTD